MVGRKTLIGKVVVGAVSVLTGVGIALGAGAVPAGAWPYPFTPDQVAFLNKVRGNFPGDDDQLVTAGLQACRSLFTGHNSQQTIDDTALAYGATPEQAGILVRAARANMCQAARG